METVNNYADEEVYWRIKHKVKKKKRRTYSENEKVLSEENLNKGSMTNVTINSEENIQSIENESNNKRTEVQTQCSETIVEIKVENIEESKMESATEVIRESSPRSQGRP